MTSYRLKARVYPSKEIWNASLLLQLPQANLYYTLDPIENFARLGSPCCEGLFLSHQGSATYICNKCFRPTELDRKFTPLSWDSEYPAFEAWLTVVLDKLMGTLPSLLIVNELAEWVERVGDLTGKAFRGRDRVESQEVQALLDKHLLTL